MSSSEATQALLRNLWERNLPLVRERVALLERAVAAASAGSLDDVLRDEAVGDAHKLAGSLGMFGYLRGTELARELEVALEAGAGAGCEAKVSELCGVLGLR